MALIGVVIAHTIAVGVHKIVTLAVAFALAVALAALALALAVTMAFAFLLAVAPALTVALVGVVIAHTIAVGVHKIVAYGVAILADSVT